MSGRAILTTSWLLAGLLVAAPASGDSVKLTNGLIYQPVRVLAAADGMIRFRMSNGRALSKPMRAVAVITLRGQNDFNRAETYLSKGKFLEADAAYVVAAREAGTGWKSDLIRYRRLAVAEKSGQTDKAVKLWLEIAEAEEAPPGVLAMRPKNLAPAKSKANDRAIALLNARLGRRGRVGSKQYVETIRRLLVDLYERQGRLAEAQAVQAKLTRQTTRPSGPSPPRPGSGWVGGEGVANAHLRLAGLALKDGNYAKIPPLLQPRLKSFSAAELPGALYLLGRAEMELAADQKDPQARKALLLRAGLNLMRVAALFPASEEAPRALLAAGRVNERLGNSAAARAAYSAVVSRFAASPAAKQAKTALERMKK